jgi:hypothetical protein
LREKKKKKSSRTAGACYDGHRSESLARQVAGNISEENLMETSRRTLLCKVTGQRRRVGIIKTMAPAHKGRTARSGFAQVLCCWQVISGYLAEAQEE